MLSVAKHLTRVGLNARWGMRFFAALLRKCTLACIFSSRTSRAAVRAAKVLRMTALAQNRSTDPLPKESR